MPMWRRGGHGWALPSDKPLDTRRRPPLRWRKATSLREGGIVPRLILIKGADEGKQFELTQPVHTVGRDSGSSIRLVDTEVSRRHAEFRLVNGSYHLVDVGSANGSFVNGQPVTDAPLQPGDRV